ncbi:HD-GYP domain-containing protein [Heyndrickxia sp. NPDC080065]|uniref:HD-GYP domain-containing protein n=1 Tax=Heyndrickxia sp. NPDC080065 TaxID=3390568 RepID=UPI003CFBCEFA
MKVNVDEVRVGAVIAEDIMGMTGHPIIPKKTVLTQKHIDVLKAFFKTEVTIEGRSIKQNKQSNFNSSTNTKIDSLEEINPNLFIKTFEETVKKYKADFQKWQSGSAVDIANVRDYLYSLLEQVEKHNINPSFLYLHKKEQDYLYYHSISVGIISGLIAKKVGYDKGQYFQTALAGCLANAGMAKISPWIINKPSALSYEESSEIREHPNHSLKMIQNSPLLKAETKLAIFQHHERLDGSGYPMGVKDKQLYPISRIVAVADVYHALISDKPYKERIAPLKAIEILQIDGFGKYDISVINALLSITANLSIGTKVRISNGQTGEVIFTKPSAITRPLIKLSDGEIIDLEKARDLYIEEVY